MNAVVRTTTLVAAMAGATALAQSALAANVCYSVRMQNDAGFRTEVCDGIIAGVGGLRLEQIKIRGMEANAHMCYKVHVQDEGWSTTPICDNAIAGTVGRRIEAVEILDDALPASQSVFYQTYVQNLGWLPVQWDGRLGGTTGQALRMEAIAIAVQPRPNCPNQTYQFANKDSLIAPSAPLYPGAEVVCDAYYHDYITSNRGIEYPIGNNVAPPWGGSQYYNFFDGRGNNWYVQYDRYDNIIDSYWTTPAGRRILLGGATRNWTASPYGVGVTMMDMKRP